MKFLDELHPLSRPSAERKSVNSGDTYLIHCLSKSSRFLYSAEIQSDCIEFVKRFYAIAAACGQCECVSVDEKLAHTMGLG